MAFQHSNQNRFHNSVTTRDSCLAVTSQVNLPLKGHVEQSSIANTAWPTSILVLTSVVFVLTTAIKFPGRKESILGETYFGSEQLLKTEIDDTKPFIAELTLPET